MKNSGENFIDGVAMGRAPHLGMPKVPGSENERQAGKRE